MSILRTSTRSPIPALPFPSDSHLDDVEPQSVERADPIAEVEGIELENETLGGGSNTPSPRPKKPSPKLLGPFSIRIIALLMPMSIFGLLARLGLDALATYPGQSIFALAWVQAAGCFAMGALLGLREPISEFYPEFYVAATSGFCGSLTTFSSWQLDVFLAFANRTTPGGYRRLWIYDIMDGLTRLLFTLAISMAALSFGFKTTSETAPGIQKTLLHFGRRPSRTTHRIVTVGSIIIYALTIPMYFVLSRSFRPQATAALLFAFPGAFTRYYLSVKLNTKRPGLPPGTLVANTLATALLATFHVLERTKGGRLAFTPCVILIGLSDGFCGCLSTVSTFASELRILEKWRAWRYAAVSVLLGQASMVLILGSAEWSGAVRESQSCR